MSGRMRRVNESLRQVLSEALLELKDPRIGFVTVTGVETSRDLRRRGSLSASSAASASASAAWRGSAAHGVLQARVSRELHLKRTPLLAFEYDPTVEQGVRMSQLIDELAPDASRRRRTLTSRRLRRRSTPTSGSS